MSNRNLESAVTIARALGHPARLRAVAMLAGGELCVCQITEVLKLATSTVSIHLRELKRCGLVSERKDGRWVWIGLSDDPLARQWLAIALEAAGDDPQLAADARLVEELRELPVEDLCRFGYDEARARASGAARPADDRRPDGGCQ
ncbi:MAG TPA: metalloregulator ArsR/SmtB family transcription factor [Candidatus Sulfomarinibacteraceae bacterium]|nr:metalloregulator ArsR/SmtB family transcription factor [Candidatus Sulfomarinibacteraceae bacterium]